MHYGYGPRYMAAQTPPSDGYGRWMDGYKGQSVQRMRGSDDGEYDVERYISQYVAPWEHDPQVRFVVFLRTYYNTSHSEVHTSRRMLGPWNYQETVTLLRQLPKHLHGADLYRDVQAYRLDSAWPAQEIPRPAAERSCAHLRPPAQLVGCCAKPEFVGYAPCLNCGYNAFSDDS